MRLRLLGCILWKHACAKYFQCKIWRLSGASRLRTLPKRKVGCTPWRLSGRLGHQREAHVKRSENMKNACSRYDESPPWRDLWSDESSHSPNCRTHPFACFPWSACQQTARGAKVAPKPTTCVEAQHDVHACLLMLRCLTPHT